jgi:hypothetical protein
LSSAADGSVILSALRRAIPSTPGGENAADLGPAIGAAGARLTDYSAIVAPEIAAHVPGTPDAGAPPTVGQQFVPGYSIMSGGVTIAVAGGAYGGITNAGEDLTIYVTGLPVPGNGYIEIPVAYLPPYVDEPGTCQIEPGNDNRITGLPGEHFIGGISFLIIAYYTETAGPFAARLDAVHSSAPNPQIIGLNVWTA